MNQQAGNFGPGFEFSADGHVRVPGEGGETEVFFSDLGPDYARFNAEYTS